MKKPKSPCRECEKRAESCRIECKEWKVYEKERQKYNEIVLAEKKKSVGVRIGDGKNTWIR